MSVAINKENNVINVGIKEMWKGLEGMVMVEAGGKKSEEME